jgi:hypothetical protein
MSIPRAANRVKPYAPAFAHEAAEVWASFPVRVIANVSSKRTNKPQRCGRFLT